MRLYHRPIPCEPGPDTFPIAGTRASFRDVEILSRDARPHIVPASGLAGDTIRRLTALRRPVAGLSLDRPRLMGVLNVTPDSFSDGGLWTHPDAALGHAEAMVEAGAELIDIGGESTRPGAAEVPAEDEIGRTAPVIAAIAGLAAPVSIDTRKAGVARAALAAGAALVNDVSGLSFDPDMAAAVAGAGVPVCLMHARGTPDVMQRDPRYADVVLDVFDALQAMVERAEAAGVLRERILIDPGIGFGKTEAHNLALLRRISVFHDLGCAILLGVSRKRFIGRIAGVERACDRGPGTLALTLAAVAQGVQMHRVHDVAMVAQGVRLWSALDDRFINQ